MINIPDHAVENYIKRVYGEDVDEPCNTLKRTVMRRIREAINNPDWIYHGRKDMPQVHVKDNAAVIVGVDPYGGIGEDISTDKLLPYQSLEQNLVVPTVYNSETYESKRNEQRKRQEA